MNIEQKLIEVLQTDPEYVLVSPTLKNPKGLTVTDIISRIIEDGGESSLDTIFKGFTASKVREALTILFYEHPKKQAEQWYLHCLKLCGYKKCPKCEQIKLLGMFSKNRAMKASGVESWCQECMRAREVYTPEYKRTLKREHQRQYKERYAEASARRRARKMLAMPSWADLSLIKVIYENCPVGYEVDHWAPLAGELVCGLHNEFNLQYLPKSTNQQKGNRFKDSDHFYGLEAI